MDDQRMYKQILYNSFTSSYQSGLDLWSKDQGLTDVARLLLSQLRPEVPQHILDVGAGNGRHAELFLQQGFRYTGIDLYRHSDWEQYERRYPRLVTFVHSTFLDWDSSDIFTAVLDNGCFHHQHPDEYGLYLQKIQQLLAAGGYLMLGLYTVSDEETTGRFQVMPSGKYRRYFTPGEIRILLEEHGFVCRQTEKLFNAERNRNYLAVLAQKGENRSS